LTLGKRQRAKEEEPSSESNEARTPNSKKDFCQARRSSRREQESTKWMEGQRGQEPAQGSKRTNWRSEHDPGKEDRQPCAEACL
jgi:hypothetical protein